MMNGKYVYELSNGTVVNLLDISKVGGVIYPKDNTRITNIDFQFEELWKKLKYSGFGEFMIYHKSGGSTKVYGKRIDFQDFQDFKDKELEDSRSELIKRMDNALGSTCVTGDIKTFNE